MNDVVLGEGNRTGISIAKGNQTKTVRTDLYNDRLPGWWVEYVRANETIHTRVSATVRASAGLSASHTFTQERTMLDGETPMIDAMSAAASSAEGNYPDGPATLYEVRRGWATWGEATQNSTVVDFHFRVHNPAPVPVPARPDGLRATVAMNDVAVIRSEGTEFSAGDLGLDSTLQPGETREIVLSVEMDNRKIDDWFVSHVRNDERTDVSVEFQLGFENPQTGGEIVLPPEGITYDCRFQTGILVDGQATDTTCGAAG
jgi:LEA14-like dessication related protein